MISSTLNRFNSLFHPYHEFVFPSNNNETFSQNRVRYDGIKQSLIKHAIASKLISHRRSIEYIAFKQSYTPAKKLHDASASYINHYR